MIATIEDLGRVEMADGLRAPCCGAPLSPQAARHAEDCVEVICPGCHALVLRVELPATEDGFDCDYD